jgi:glycosyltransferase involved in cell wall biosynthesis
LQNEEANIARAIHSVHVAGSRSQPQIIVVDGGSSDRTVQVASRSKAAEVLVVDGWRGTQLNAGVRRHIHSTIPRPLSNCSGLHVDNLASAWRLGVQVQRDHVAYGSYFCTLIASCRETTLVLCQMLYKIVTVATRVEGIDEVH